METAFDVVMIGVDIADIHQNGLNWGNGLSLGFDIAAIILPGIPAVGAVILKGGKVGKAAVEAATHTDDVGDAIRAIDKIDNIADLPTQIHHFASNKSKKFTGLFEDIIEKYGLDLNGKWNKLPLPHRGRHPYKYHEWVLDNMRDISNSLENCKKNCDDLFKKAFTKKVIKPVVENPAMLRKEFWR